jgi:hypothetical protein
MALRGFLVSSAGRAGCSLAVGVGIVVGACSLGSLDEAGKRCSDQCPSGLPCIQGTCGGTAVPTDAHDAPAADGGGDGPVNLLPNPGFEEGLGNGCDPWNRANAVRSTLARTGAYSCLVCPSGGGTPGFFALDAPNVDVAAGSTFYAEAWLMAPPSGPVAAKAAVALELLEPDGGDVHDYGNGIAPTSTWKLSSETVTMEANGQLRFEIHSIGSDAGCVLVDDTAMYPR